MVGVEVGEDEPRRGSVTPSVRQAAVDHGGSGPVSTRTRGAGRAAAPGRIALADVAGHHDRHRSGGQAPVRVGTSATGTSAAPMASTGRAATHGRSGRAGAGTRRSADRDRGEQQAAPGTPPARRRCRPVLAAPPRRRTAIPRCRTTASHATNSAPPGPHRRDDGRRDPGMVAPARQVRPAGWPRCRSG